MDGRNTKRDACGMPHIGEIGRIVGPDLFGDCFTTLMNVSALQIVFIPVQTQRVALSMMLSKYINTFAFEDSFGPCRP